MSHHFTLTVEVELSRSQGKFASRDEMVEALVSEIEGADPGGLYGIGADSDSDYDVDSFEVQEASEPLSRKRIQQILQDNGVAKNDASSIAGQIVNAR